MAYDKADWHTGGNFPDSLPDENGGTHIGMFLAWMIKNNLEGDFHLENSRKELQQVKDEEITGRDFFFSMCDGKFWTDDLSEKGNLFAKHYYESDLYLYDYEEVLGSELDSLYEVEDTWDNFHKLASKILKAYTQWEAPKKWWKFW